jgi:hypothetical protein
MTAEQIIKGYGGPAKLAHALGLDPALVWRWQKRGIPAAKVGIVSALTGQPFHCIRPDLFPQPAAAPAPDRVPA